MSVDILMHVFFLKIRLASMEYEHADSWVIELKKDFESRFMVTKVF